MYGGNVLAHSFDYPLLAQVIHLLVLSNNNALPYSEVVLGVVVYQRTRVGVCDDAHASLDEGLSCTHVPVLEARDEVDVVVGFLVEDVDDLVAGACYSGRVHGVDG